MSKARISPTFTDEEFLTIKQYAENLHISMSEAVRTLALKGLNIEISQQNLDFICKIVSQELKKTIRPETDRLASLISKTCIMSATATYLTAETINRFVPTTKQSEVQTVYSASRKKAIDYIKRPFNDVDD